jgi:hypothetical protein
MWIVVKSRALELEVFAPLQSSEYDGIQDMSTALPRAHLVAALYGKVASGSSRFIHVALMLTDGRWNQIRMVAVCALIYRRRLW